MQEKQNKIKTPAVFYVGVALLCALLVTSYMMGGLYARYTAGTKANATAPVAAFSFSVTYGENSSQSQTFTLPADSMKPGETVSIPFTVKNSGDVTVKYTAKIENLTSNLPLTLTGETGKLESNESSESAQIQIKWDASNNDSTYAGKMDLLRITVTVEQVD